VMINSLDNKMCRKWSAVKAISKSRYFIPS
jgi:hypothetical protein